MNFNMFSSSSHVDCAIQINFNLDAVDIHVIRVNVNTMRIHSGYSLWCKQDLRLREVMDSNIPNICVFACHLLLCTRLSSQIRETIRTVHYCEIIAKAKKVKEGSLICPDNDFTIEAI